MRPITLCARIRQLLSRGVAPATRPAGRPERTGAVPIVWPESQTALPLDPRNPWSRNGQGRARVAGHRVRCQTALASSSNAIEKKRKLLKDRCSWILQFKRVVFSMQYPPPTLASAQILFRRCPHGNRILAQPDRDVTAAPETTLVLPPGLDSYRTCRGTGNQSTFQRRCKPQRRRPRRLPPWA